MKSAFNVTISNLLNNRLSRFVNLPLTKTLCLEMYQEIFGTLVEVFKSSDVELSNEAVNYVSQLYYDCISINETDQSLDPNIFSKRAKVENIKTQELALLAMLLKTDKDPGLSVEILAEIKRRG